VSLSQKVWSLENLDEVSKQAHRWHEHALASLDEQRMTQLACEFTQNRLVVIRQLVDRSHARALLAATKDVPARRVKCGTGGVTWDEQNFSSGHLVYRLFERPEISTLAKRLSGLENIDQLSCWTSCYVAGEYINSHRDGAGSIQVLVCLQAPLASASGGVLIADGREIYLAPGDAVVFDATRVTHRTSALVVTEDDAEPRRVVLVGRYYLS
jgi:hypothetical protein